MKRRALEGRAMKSKQKDRRIPGIAAFIFPPGLLVCSSEAACCEQKVIFRLGSKNPLLQL
jgi:hypothetical protein